LVNRRWDLVIVDEAHYFKDFGSKRTQVLFGSPRRGHPGVQSQRRLTLTGTPIPNRTKELFPILNWLQPRKWGTKQAFEKRYCGGFYDEGWSWSAWVADGASNLDELAENLRSTVMVRRLKADVLPQLPAKRRSVVLLNARDIGRPAVRALADERKAVAGMGTDWADQVRSLTPKAPAFTAIAAVRKATALTKAPAVATHVRDCLEDDPGKVVVWAHHHDVIDVLVDDLAGFGVVVVDGRTNPAGRAQLVEYFQTDPEYRVFVGGITAAGHGITLTAASHVVFAELDWRPGVCSQAEDRSHRLGTTDFVLVEHVLLDGSIDALMAQRILEKQAVATAVLDSEAVAC
jgi:SWI/SNF-related matrix-associated actin-dependent regulator 1 of chromatin subfamily A